MHRYNQAATPQTTPSGREQFPQIINVDAPPNAGDPAAQDPLLSGELLTKDIFFVGYLLTRGLRITEMIYDPRSRCGKVLFAVNGPLSRVYAKEYNEEQAVANLAELKTKIDFVRDQMFDFIRSNEAARRPAAQHTTEQAACNTHRNMSRR